MHSILKKTCYFWFMVDGLSKGVRFPRVDIYDDGFQTDWEEI